MPAMPHHERDHALQMLEQICANFSWEKNPEVAAAAVAAHIKRFWTPAMRRMVCEAVSAGDASPSELGRRVVSLIA
jgi:formate dehydrogenase subunit delta